MTVKDLIERLKAFDPESLVVTRGLDEEGFAEIKKVKPWLKCEDLGTFFKRTSQA